MGSSLLKMGKIVALTFSLLIHTSLASLPFKKREAWLREWDCSGCMKFSEDVIMSTTAEESINQEIELILPLCDGLEDPAACREILPPFWTALVSVLYPEIYSVENICSTVCQINLENPLAPKETCGECMAALAAIDEAFASVEFEVYMVLFLDENFCPSQEILDPQVCHDVMPTLIPSAYQILLSYVTNEGNYYWCDEVHNAC